MAAPSLCARSTAGRDARAGFDTEHSPPHAPSGLARTIRAVFARVATEPTDSLAHRPRARREDEEPERAPAPIERLEDELTELAAQINAGTCRWLELLAQFDRRDGWGQPGVRSCADWLSWRCAVSPSEAREHVRVAHKLCELPVIRAAFSRAELSYWQAARADPDRGRALRAGAARAGRASDRRAARARAFCLPAPRASRRARTRSRVPDLLLGRGRLAPPARAPARRGGGAASAGARGRARVAARAPPRGRHRRERCRRSPPRARGGRGRAPRRRQTERGRRCGR